MPAGQGRLVVRHTAAAPAVDIVLAGGSRPFTNLSNPNEAAAALPAGQIAGARVAPAGGDPIADVPTVDLEAGTDLIVYAVGSLEAGTFTFTFYTQVIEGLGAAPGGVNTGDGLPSSDGSALPAALAAAAGVLALTGAGLLVTRRRATPRLRSWWGGRLRPACVGRRPPGNARSRRQPVSSGGTNLDHLAPPNGIDQGAAVAALVAARRRRVGAPAPAVARHTPVGIAIEAIGVGSPVRAVGVQDDGWLEIPDETEVGWYRFGSAPGQLGVTVLAAHVNWHHVDGPFVRLRRLDPGATVVLALDDGSTRTYVVAERQMSTKTELRPTASGPAPVRRPSCSSPAAAPSTRRSAATARTSSSTPSRSPDPALVAIFPGSDRKIAAKASGGRGRNFPY